MIHSHQTIWLLTLAVMVLYTFTQVVLAPMHFEAQQHGKTLSPCLFSGTTGGPSWSGVEKYINFLDFMLMYIPRFFTSSLSRIIDSLASRRLWFVSSSSLIFWPDCKHLWVVGVRSQVVDVVLVVLVCLVGGWLLGLVEMWNWGD